MTTTRLIEPSFTDPSRSVVVRLQGMAETFDVLSSAAVQPVRSSQIVLLFGAPDLAT